MRTYLAVLMLVGALTFAPSTARAGGGDAGVRTMTWSNGDLGFLLRADGMRLTMQREFPENPDPGKIRQELLFSGWDGEIYVMVWDLRRLDRSEWFFRAVDPMLSEDRFWQPVPWLFWMDESATVEVPGDSAHPAQRLYAVRSGHLGFAVICSGVEHLGLSEACTRLAGSLEVVR